MEEESQEILLRSMESCGVVIPPSVSSVRDLTPSTFVSICAQCLNSIDDTASIPTSLPSESESERIRICTDVASAVKNLGYVGDISFQKFLYPSEEDFNMLIRFLAKRIFEHSETGNGRIADSENISKPGENDLKSSLEGSAKKPEDEGAVFRYSNIGTKLNDLRLDMNLPETLRTEPDASINRDNQTSVRSKEFDLSTDTDPSSSSMADLSKDEHACALNEEDLVNGLVVAVRDSSGNEEIDAHMGNGHIPVLKQKTRTESDKLQIQEKVVIDNVIARASDLKHLEQELALLIAAAEMALNDQHSVDFYLDQLSEQLQAKRNSLSKLELEWDAVRKPLEERRTSLEECLFSNNPDAEEIFQKLREVEQEEQFILSEIEKRDDEYSKLSAYLEEQPKVESRKSYIQQIKEITKNSRKQDTDTEQILKETREVQLESNSTRERLHRTYAVADEIVFREAKKDSTGRQVYRLLTRIHECFEQISEKILATDRIQREVAEYEMKLAAMASKSLDVSKPRADLNAVTRENELAHPFQDK